jgi:hypothetical protein
MKQTYTRQEVIDLIDNLLQHGDTVMDAISSEDPKHDPEELLEIVEAQMEREDKWGSQDTMMRYEGEINPER